MKASCRWNWHGLQYLGSRLVRRWSHLERQTGGAGQRGGPGEAQIELDKRMIAERVKSLKARLVKVKRQRDTQRHARRNSGSFRVSLVGYTNAGKSTLFNALVKARGLCGRPVVRHARHHHPLAVSRSPGRHGVAVRHRGFHPRSAAQVGRGLRGHACRRPAMPTCCCMWSMRPARCCRSSATKSSACWPRSALPMCRRFWSSTSSTRWIPLPRLLQDWVERPGAAAVPRVFVSALRGTGLDTLRSVIAQAAASGGLNPPGQSPPDGLPEAPADPATAQTPVDAPLPSAMT